MKITINQIAEMAGVSRGAVDKVIHDRPGVREDIRERVQQIIQETGYIPKHFPKDGGDNPFRKVVAVIIPKGDNPFFEQVKRGIDKAVSNCHSPNLELQYYFCSETDVQGMISILDYLDTRTVHGYLIRGINDDRLGQRLKRIEKKGIPIYFIDSDAPHVKARVLIGEDCYRSGRVAASLLAKALGDRGTVAIVGGFPEVVSHQKRIEGFLDTIKERWPEIQVVEQIYTYEQSTLAYENTRRLLQDHIDLSGIYSMAGYAGQVGRAITESGRKGKTRLVCYNKTDAVIRMLKDGTAAFSISLNPFYQGELAAETIVDDLLYRQKPESEFIKTPIEIVMDELL